MSHRFFLSGSWSVGEGHSLDSEQSHHATRVLRLEKGASVEVFNGEGVVGRATIDAVDKKAVHIAIAEAGTVPNPWNVTVAFSIGKPPVTEFILKRLTEVGVRRFQPLRSKHSHPGDFKTERWKKVLLEVCKQCQETHVPSIEELRPLGEWITAWAPKPIVLCDEFRREAEIDGAVSATETALLVGPEGGWETSELQSFNGNKAITRLGLGRNRLRAETASLVGAVMIKRALGELPA